MISLRSLSIESKRARALIASAFFLLIVPQKIHSEPISTFILGTVLAAGAYAGGELLTYAINLVVKPAKKTESIQKKAVKEISKTIVMPQLPANPVTTTSTQTPEANASQVIIHNNNHITTINVDAASSGNKFVLSTNVTGAPTPTMQPTQTIQTTQTIEPTVQPLATPTSGIPNDPAAQASMMVYDHLKDFYQNHYGKIGLATAATGYVYVLYSVASLQHYLTDNKRIGLWFSDYDFNKLLLLEFDTMQELLIQEFISTYNVSDQKSLKVAVSNFLNDMETELASLERYGKIAGRIDTVSALIGKCCSPCCDIARAMVPFAGLVFDYTPTISINNLFFVNSTLKTTIQERISRIHYYKNIFLQSTIVI